MSRVLVIRFSSFGDVVLALQAVSQIQSQGLEAHFLTKQKYSKLVKVLAPGCRVHAIPDQASFLQLLQKLREIKNLDIDAVIDHHRNLRSWVSSLYFRWHCGISVKRISKIRWKELALFILRKGLYRAWFTSIPHRAAAAAEFLGKNDGFDDQLESSPVQIGGSGLWHPSEKDTYIAIGFESAWREKSWPLDRFVALAARLWQEQKIKTIWLGTKRLESTPIIDGIVDLSGKLPSEDLPNVLTACRLIVCNDSGLMHLAERVGVPAVAIFGPTTTDLGFGPRLPLSRVVESDLWCRPCSKTGRWCFRMWRQQQCLQEVSVDSVYQSVSEVLRHR